MRSLPLLAATTVILTAAWACGSDGNGPEDPVANFTAPTCTAGTACTFTDQSTGTISTWSWNFGDNTTPDTNQNPSHIFANPGTYTVVLTVTGNGKTSTKSVDVTIGGGTGNQAPVASFSLTTPTCTAGTPCGFHSTSGDPDGTIASAHWDFGDGEAGDGLDAYVRDC
jgi:PKD repeat protein